MQDFAAEWIHHAHCPIEYRADDRRVQSGSFDEFAQQHALIDQRNMEITGHQPSIRVFNFTWIGNYALDALRFEIVFKQYELTVAGHFTPVQNSNTWSLTMSCPLLIAIYEGIEHAMACW